MDTQTTLSDNNKSVANKSVSGLVIVGGLLIDDTAMPLAQMKLNRSNPVTWQHHIGGVASNVARASVVKLPTRLIACIGNDPYGSEIEAYFANSPICASLIKRTGQASDKYTAVLDENRDLLIGLADAQLAQTLTWPEIQSRLATDNLNALVLDANLSPACLADAVTFVKSSETRSQEQANLNSSPAAATNKPPLLIALAVSPVKATRLTPHASALDLLICNRREAQALSNQKHNIAIEELGNKLYALSYRRFVITDGAHPALVQEDNTQTLINPSSTSTVKTVNGAGDALSGATISAWVLGKSLADAVRLHGMPAAADVLTGTQPAPSL